MNKKIIIAVFVIAGSGVVTAVMGKKPVTPVVMGSYVFLLVLSIADMFGGPLSNVAGGLALVAAISVLLNQFPWSTILALAGFKQSGEAGSLSSGAETSKG